MKADPDSKSINVDHESTGMDSQDTFVNSMAGRVRTRAEEMNISPSALADAAGIKRSSMTYYWRGDRPYPVECVPELARTLSTTVNWLMLGVVAESETVAEVEAERDFVAVDEIDLVYGLGGTFSDGPVVTVTHKFPRLWLEAITATPPNMLTFAKGRGDSMQPTIQDGDMVLIDRSQRTIREQDAIWALTIGDIAMIKRVRARGARIMLLSDNDRVPADEVFHEELNVIGRVIFLGRKL